MGVVSEVMSSSAVAESSLQYEADDEDKRRKRKLRLDALPKGYIKDDETAEAGTLQHGKMPKTRIELYKVGKVLGKGAFGTVVRAHDHLLK